MSNNEILEGNKLIAEFLKYEPRWIFGNTEKINASDVIYGYYLEGEPNKKTMNGLSFCETKEMEYRTSWEWIMPVGKKIMKLNLIESEQLCQRTPAFYLNPIRNGAAEFNIEVLWKSIVDFIKWYNAEIKNVQPR